MNKLAFIGGSGIYDPKILEKTKQKKLKLLTEFHTILLVYIKIKK